MAQAPPCPYCGGTSYKRREQRWLICQGCSHEFDLQRELCRSCGHLNSSGLTHCANCQAPLDADDVDKLISERSKDRLAWRAERAAAGVAQKAEEDVASQRRMEAYWADDRARREAQAQIRAEQALRERKVLAIVVVISVVLILLVIVLTVLFAPGREGVTRLLEDAVPSAERLAIWVARHTLQTGLG